jgi:hypothetical protein
MKGIVARGIFAALFLAPSLCAFAQSPNLCTEQEDTSFTCTLKNSKLVSVCGAADLSDRAGYLVYRYGTKEKIELSFPNRPTEFRRITSQDETVDDKTGEDDQFIHFRNGRFSYIIYSAIGHKFHLEGLAVFENHKLLSNNQCLPDTSHWGLVQNDLLSVGVPLQDDGEAMRFWKQLLPGNSAVVSQKSSNAPRK